MAVTPCSFFTQHPGWRTRTHGTCGGDLKGNRDLPWPLKSWPELFIRPGLHHFPSLQIPKVSHMTTPGISRKVSGAPPHTALSTDGGICIPRTPRGLLALIRRRGFCSTPSKHKTKNLLFAADMSCVWEAQAAGGSCKYPPNFPENADLCGESDE